MNVLIVEDEAPAVKQLIKLINKYPEPIHILETIDSVEGTLSFLKTAPPLDLIFLDIHLADGQSFEIFNRQEIHTPLIFTTAYDQFTLKAFKHNSVDYLLKPIEEVALHQALDKYIRFHQQGSKQQMLDLRESIRNLLPKKYKERFVVKSGQQLLYITTQQIAYFLSDQGILYCKSFTGKKHALEYTLDQLEDLLNPDLFFRINRKSIIHIDAIQKINTYFNSRLILELSPSVSFDVIVSRDRVANFKNWLDR